MRILSRISIDAIVSLDASSADAEDDADKIFCAAANLFRQLNSTTWKCFFSSRRLLRKNVSSMSCLVVVVDNRPCCFFTGTCKSSSFVRGGDG